MNYRSGFSLKIIKEGGKVKIYYIFRNLYVKYVKSLSNFPNRVIAILRKYMIIEMSNSRMEMMTSVIKLIYPNFNLL